MELIKMLARASGCSEQRINDLAANSEKEYKVFYMRKKGGKREIAEPGQDLKKVMCALNEIVFKKLKVSKYCTAYNEGDSILKNASKHKKAAILYKFDIKRFFPSIAFRHLTAVLDKRFGDKQIDLIWRLVSYKKGLPIGAPTSPFIANAVCFSLDKQIAKNFRRAVFTRYADDIAISYSSRKRDKSDVPALIVRILRDNDFRLNTEKTRISYAGRAKRVTGLTLSGGDVTVGHKYKDAVKKQIYNLLVLKKGNRQKAAGKFNFIRQIEPAYAWRLREKYFKFDQIGFFNDKVKNYY